MDNQYGHKQMIVWQNADKLDTLVQIFLKRVPKNEFRSREQIDSASGSISANYVEGYYSGSLQEYIKFIRYAKRSCAELNEHIRRINRKGYISDPEYANFDKLTSQTMYLFNRLLMALESKLIKRTNNAK